MESASFMEQDVVERSNKEPLQRGMTDSHKPVQVRQRIDTNQFNGANARVDGNRNESLLGVSMQEHFDQRESKDRSPWNADKPEIDTGRSTYARTRSFVGSSTVETHVHASLGALSEATIYGVNAQADALWTAALNEARASRGTEAWAMSSHDMSEISTDHPTLSRSQSASNNSLPVGGPAPTTYDHNPPTEEEITEAFYWKYGLADETD